MSGNSQGPTDRAAVDPLHRRDGEAGEPEVASGDHRRALGAEGALPPQGGS
jgi:hypothetical protein